VAPGDELAQAKAIGVASRASVAGQETGQGETLPVAKGSVEYDHRCGWCWIHWLPPESQGLGARAPEGMIEGWAQGFDVSDRTAALIGNPGHSERQRPRYRLWAARREIGDFACPVETGGAVILSPRETLGDVAPVDSGSGSAQAAGALVGSLTPET
jgi:hypothetical protein